MRLLCNIVASAGALFFIREINMAENLLEMTEEELALLRAKLTDEQLALREQIRRVDIAWKNKQLERQAQETTKDYSIEQLEAILESKKKAQIINPESIVSEEGVNQ